MRKRIDENGFTLWLSASDTYDWAHKSGAAWPGSLISGNRIVVQYDSNGIVDFALNGRDDMDIDGQELSACAADHIYADLGEEHPCRAVLAQFMPQV